jgi:hypothetical protein
MQVRRGLRDWWIGVNEVAAETRGIERLFGFALCVLRLATPTEWVHLGFGTKERPLHSFSDAYVVGVVIVSAIIYSFPHVPLAWLSTYLAASTLVVLLNVVLFDWWVYREKASVGRSLLLFICNVAQITLMFATWYRLGGGSDPLLISVLTLATISYEQNMPTIAMIQIATNFVLLAVFLSHLVGQLGQKPN